MCFCASVNARTVLFGMYILYNNGHKYHQHWKIRKMDECNHNPHGKIRSMYIYMYRVRISRSHRFRTKLSVRSRYRWVLVHPSGQRVYKHSRVHRIITCVPNVFRVSLQTFVSAFITYIMQFSAYPYCSKSLDINTFRVAFVGGRNACWFYWAIQVSWSNRMRLMLVELTYL